MSNDRELWAPEPGDKDYIPKTIDLTPSWKAAASIYIMTLESGHTPRAKELAKAGIMEMAEKFDALIDSMKPEEKCTQKFGEAWEID